MSAATPPDSTPPEGEQRVRERLVSDHKDARDILAIAREVAAEAAAFLRGSAGRVGRIDSKTNPRDLVTEWDRRTEDLIRARLQTLTPQIPMLGEERGSSVGKDGEATTDRWLIDPIDGTVNFAHGLPIYAVSVAYERAGEPLAGAVYAPALGWEFHAYRGGGAYLGDERLAVSQTAALSQALLVTGFPYDRATNPDNNFHRWEHFQCRAGACRRLGAASLDLCLVAQGSFDGYWENQLNPWDIGAGLLLVEEAGGRISNFENGPVALDVGEVVASNGTVHDDIVAELRELAVAAAASSSNPL